MTDGEKDRYEYFISRIKTLSEKYNLPTTKIFDILENIEDFKNMYNISEFDKFLVFYYKEKRRC